MKARKTNAPRARIALYIYIAAASAFGLMQQPAAAYTILAPGAVVAGKSIATWSLTKRSAG